MIQLKQVSKNFQRQQVLDRLDLRDNTVSDT